MPPGVLEAGGRRPGRPASFLRWDCIGPINQSSIEATCLEIDRRFLSGIGAGGVDDAIVRAIVDIGHALGLVTVAEGVEREEQRAALEALGCDLVQGWLVAPALTGEEVGKRLAAEAGEER